MKTFAIFVCGLVAFSLVQAGTVPSKGGNSHHGSTTKRPPVTTTTRRPHHNKPEKEPGVVVKGGKICFHSYLIIN